MNRTEIVTRDVPIRVVLRDDGGPCEYLADFDREPGPDEWGCVVTWHLSEGAFRVGRVELLAPAPQSIGPLSWRWVRLGEVIQASQEALEILGHVGMFSSGMREASGQALTALAGDRARRGWPPEHFEVVAGAYNLAVSLGDLYPVRATRQSLARSLGWEPSPATVKGWIRTAKRRALITTTARPSRAGNRAKGQSE